MRRCWIVYLAAMACCIAAYPLVPEPPRAWAFDAVSLLAAVVVLVAVRLQRIARPLPWLLVAAGLHRAVPMGQTCSAGVAQWDGLEACEELLQRADEALYAAKRAGRHRTELAAPGLSLDGPSSDGRSSEGRAPSPPANGTAREPTDARAAKRQPAGTTPIC